VDAGRESSPLSHRWKKSWLGASLGGSKVRRHLSSPPIRRPGGKFYGSDEKFPKAPSVKQLTSMIVNLRLENSDALAEWKLQTKELKDDFRTLRCGLCTKIKGLYKASGHDNLYNAAQKTCPLYPFPLGAFRLGLSPFISNHFENASFF
jgi:hypothetical protein